MAENMQVNLPDPDLAWPYDTQLLPKSQFSQYQVDLELDLLAFEGHFLQQKSSKIDEKG